MINGFPASIGQVIEQQDFLDRYLQKKLRPKYVFRNSVAARNIQYFEGQIGETKTFTRPAALAPNITPLNPALNTGLDNGITPQNRSFEQWQAQLYEWAGGINRNVLGNETLLADLFLDDLKELVEQAANTLEMVTSNRLTQKYDTGDTFCITAVSSSQNTIHVDNIYGFDTQYATSSLSPSYGLPVATSATNPVPILIINGTTGAVRYSTTVTAVAADPTNTSYMQSGALINGASGTLTLSSNISTVSVGDRVVAMDPNNPSTTAFNPIYKDGSYVVRPLASGLMVQDAYQMAATNTVVPGVQIPQAVAILKRRGIPPLRNGLYGCAIDATILAGFYQDNGFLQATMGTFERGNVFENGIIAKGWGTEFTDATQLPVYNAPTGGFALRHAFVFGEDVVSEHPFAPARDAVSRAGKTGDMFDFRWVDRIEIITQAALDRLGEVLKMSYKYVGDFEPGTDKTSNPTIINTSDYCRFKRGVLIQVASPI